MGRRKWSRGDIDRLFDLRDVQRMAWEEIAKVFADTMANCCVRHNYYHTKRRIEALRRGDPPPERPASFRVKRNKPGPKPKPGRKSKAGPPPAAALTPTAAKTPSPVCRPRYFHEADADIVARIERQGLTAGWLGDPPAGRSALDMKRGDAI